MSSKFTELLFEKGLYDTVSLEKSDEDSLVDFFKGKENVRCYCVNCKTESIFKLVPPVISHEDRETGEPMQLSLYLERNITRLTMAYSPIPGEHSIPDIPLFWEKSEVVKRLELVPLKYICSMDGTHSIDFAITCHDGIIRKIGQYPSVADLSLPELEEYKAVLSKEDRALLRRAIGLNSQNIGAGSFVYLRRVIESLILDAQEKALADDVVTEEQLRGVRVIDRIPMFNGYLPEEFVENRGIYSILSKGVHELSEEECLKYFPLMKETVLMIVEALEEKRRRKERKERVKREINIVHSQLG